MSNSYISDRNKYLLLIPFFYALATRYKWPRDFLANSVTAWVPGVILVYALTPGSLGVSFISYVLGYISFICIYEIGYLANDTYSVRYDAIPRRRISISVDKRFATIFVASKLFLSLFCAALLGVLSDPFMWLAYSALALTLVFHNVLRSVQYKFITFLQLSIFRFTLPILPALLWSDNLKIFPLVAITGILLFTYPRFITYLDAKGRLQLPERKDAVFHFVTHFLALPLVSIVALSWETWAPILVWAWFMMFQLAFLSVSFIPAFERVKRYIGNG